jgi:hypothetical protein
MSGSVLVISELEETDLRSWLANAEASKHQLGLLQGEAGPRHCEHF